MRSHFLALLLIVAVPPAAALMAASQFSAPGYVFCAIFFPLTIMALPHAADVAVGRRLTLPLAKENLRIGLVWLAWFIAACGGIWLLLNLTLYLA